VVLEIPSLSAILKTTVFKMARPSPPKLQSNLGEAGPPKEAHHKERFYKSTAGRRRLKKLLKESKKWCYGASESAVRK